MRQNEALDKILCCEGSWMEFIFSSLNGISVPEKNIGYEFLFRLRQREIHKGQNYYEKQSLETSNSGYALKQQVSKL